MQKFVEFENKYWKVVKPTWSAKYASLKIRKWKVKVKGLKNVGITCTLSSLSNWQACSLILFNIKIHPTRFYLRAFYRQAAPNSDYSFIKFKEKFQVTRLFQPTRLHIRELRVKNKYNYLYPNNLVAVVREWSEGIFATP